VCANCDRVSDGAASGWRAYKYENEEEGGPPEVLAFCPDCAVREFGDT
jgi:hypothetical protein